MTSFSYSKSHLLTATFMLSLGFLVLNLTSCGAGDSVTDADEEIALVTGELASSLDEMAISGSGGFALMNQSPTFETAAATCSSLSFGSCNTASGEKTKTYGNCSIGSYTLSGSTILKFLTDPSGCSLPNTAGAQLRRTANYTIKGARGNLAVSANSVGDGQTLTRSGTPSIVNYSIQNVRRVLTDSFGAVHLNSTLNTTSSFTVQGTTNRTGRTVTGGVLQIVDNLKNTTTVLSPLLLTWSNNCTCPTSGSWTGTRTLSDGSTEDIDLDVVTCTTTRLTIGARTRTLTLDRCQAI